MFVFVVRATEAAGPSAPALVPVPSAPGPTALVEDEKEEGEATTAHFGELRCMLWLKSVLPAPPVTELFALSLPVGAETC